MRACAHEQSRTRQAHYERETVAIAAAPVPAACGARGCPCQCHCAQIVKSSGAQIATIRRQHDEKRSMSSMVAPLSPQFRQAPSPCGMPQGHSRSTSQARGERERRQRNREQENGIVLLCTAYSERIVLCRNTENRNMHQSITTTRSMCSRCCCY